MTAYIIALIALFALQIADVVSTNRVIAGGGREDNPAMAWVMDKFGRAWWVGKLSIAALIGFILYGMGPTWFGWSGVAVIGAAYAWVVNHNLAVSRRQRARR